MESKKKRNIALTFLVFLLLLLLLLLRGCREDVAVSIEADPDLLSILLELREELEWPGIDVATAASNLETPEAVIEFVRNGTIYLPYPGTFADPDAVLRTRTANSVDRARLVEALLSELGFETRMRMMHSNGGEHFPGEENRKRPESLQKLADYLEYDLSGFDDEAQSLTAEFNAVADMLSQETSGAFDAIQNLAPDFMSPPPPAKIYKGEPKWYWTEYRSNDSESWSRAEPTYLGEPNPYHSHDASIYAEPTQVGITGVRGDGTRVNLMSWKGDAVGRDLEVLFLPADRKPEELLTIREPNEIWTWLSTIQVGDQTFRGNPFTPEGAVLSSFNGDPAPFVNKKGNLDLFAPEVDELTVSDASCGDGKRVRVRLHATTSAPPRWHVGNFSVLDGGKPVKQLRMETAASEPKPVIIVVDRSGSMTEDGRQGLAKKAVGELVDLLPDHQRVGLITHGYGHVTINEELKPKSEGSVKEKINKTLFWSNEAVLPAVTAALKMADEPSTILFLTDGRDTAAGKDGYAEKLQSTIDAISQSESTFIPVGIGEADPVLMTRFAEAGGTDFISIKNTEDLPVFFAQIGSSLSGAVELSYVIPEEAEAGTTRELSVILDNFDGEASGSYEVKEGTPFGLVRIELSVTGNPNINRTRTLIDFSDGYDGWRMMTKASLWMSPSVFAPHMVESRRVDEWIEALLMADYMDGGPLDRSEFSRSFSYRQGSTLNRIDTWHSAISPKSPLPKGPALWMHKESLRLAGETLMRRSDLDWLGSYDWPVVENREELARSFLALLSAEGIVWGGKSVNAILLESANPLEAISTSDTADEKLPKSLTHLPGDPENSTVILNRELPSVGWRLDGTTGGVYGYVAHGQEIAKGVTLEETAAEFREIRSMIQMYSAFGGGALSGAMLPSGAVFSALCAHFDQIVRLYCYSTLMMQQVNDAIAGENDPFDPKKAKSIAETLCETSGDADDIARNLMKETAYGFGRGTVENVIAGKTGSEISKKAGFKPGSAADVATSAGTSAGTSGTNPTPGTVQELSRSIGAGGSYSPVSSPSFSTVIDQAVFGNK